MTQMILACAVADLADGEMRPVDGSTLPLAICRVGDEFYAFRNNCTHEDFPLTEGLLEGGEVECPLHGARFCVRTGAVRAIPANEGLQVFAVRVEQGEVLIELTP